VVRFERGAAVGCRTSPGRRDRALCCDPHEREVGPAAARVRPSKRMIPESVPPSTTAASRSSRIGSTVVCSTSLNISRCSLPIPPAPPTRTSTGRPRRNPSASNAGAMSPTCETSTCRMVRARSLKSAPDDRSPCSVTCPDPPSQSRLGPTPCPSTRGHSSDRGTSVQKEGSSRMSWIRSHWWLCSAVLRHLVVAALGRAPDGNDSTPECDLDPVLRRDRQRRLRQALRGGGISQWSPSLRPVHVDRGQRQGGPGAYVVEWGQSAADLHQPRRRSLCIRFQGTTHLRGEPCSLSTTRLTNRWLVESRPGAVGCGGSSTMGARLT
jgi:hypothetical protein